MLNPAPVPGRIDPRHLARLEGWGMAVDCLCHHHLPRDAEALAAVFEHARAEQRPVCLRGGGNSYGDAAILDDGIVLDLSRMNRILGWDPERGELEVEPGVTIEQMWKHIIPDGHWPRVVSGTMKTTAGGCAAMNVHGKNNFRVGAYGDNLVDFDLMLPSGEMRRCSRENNSELFHAAVGGFGMLGAFTRLRLRTKRVHSGLLRVEAFNTPDIPSMIREFEERHEESDYLVGWIDCLKGGRGLGRGIVHQAFYLAEGEDPRPRDHLSVAAQDLPATMFGVVPKSMMWVLLSPFVNRPGMRLINAMKYAAGAIAPHGQRYFQTHAAFAFLLDYVPNWKRSYKPTGLIQYQSFIPRERAASTFEALLRTAQRAGLPPFLGVFKKHRPDPFWLTHALDGYSLALDFRVTPKNREALWQLAHRLDEIVLNAEGRFYFAKDATLRPGAPARFLPADRLERFAALKRECDPDNLLQSDLSRRLFGEDFRVAGD